MASLKSDICIIGANFEALASAKILSEAGFRVLIVEPSDRLGGVLTPTQTEYGALSKQFSYWPAGQTTELALRFLSRALNKELTPVEETLPPQTFSKGQFQTFVGFGEFAPPFVDEVSNYLKDSQYTNLASPSQYLEELQSNLNAQLVFGQDIVKFEIQNEKITLAELEDGRSVEAKAYLLFADPKPFLALLPSEEYTQRELQRIHRTPLWTTLSLDIIHSTEVTNEKTIFLLTGTVKDSIPCVGRFDSLTEHEGKKIQSSHWLTFIPAETEDEEVTANALREIKRQIRRAFPTALEQTLFEKITIMPASAGSLPLKADAQSRWPGTTNLWLSSRHLNAHSGHVGALCQAALATEAVISGLSQPENNELVALSHI